MPFKLSLDITANMRQRVTSPVPELQVGAYLHSNTQSSFSDQGVEMQKMHLRDLARKARSEIDARLPSFRATVWPLYMDEYMNATLTGGARSRTCA